MNTSLRRFAAAPVLFAFCAAVTAAGEPVSGWRGNGTGLWPNAQPTIEWSRIPHGALEGLSCQAQRPASPVAGSAASGAPRVEKGLLRDWLVLGPFSVGDSEKDFDQDPIARGDGAARGAGGEAALEPPPAAQAAGAGWKPASSAPDDPMVFGTAELAWLDVGKAAGAGRDQLAYAHTYLYSPRGGPARVVVDHSGGLKAWLNGREVYRSPRERVALGFYTSISRQELEHSPQDSGRFDVTLPAGWSRLLLKLGSSRGGDQPAMRLAMRIMDPPDVAYETKNIRWMTELPGRSTSTPILAGGRLFLMAEPDELLCLEPATGHILWTQPLNFYEALSPEERRSQPAYAGRIDPLIAELRRETDRARRISLRAKMQEALREIDDKRFSEGRDGHFEAHFGIVGYTMPTPLSDGARVYAWCNLGVAACYDLDGRRQWITRLDTGELTYGSSPALAGGVLAVYLNQLHALDAATGARKWSQPRIHKNIAAIQAVRLAGQNVFITQPGEVIRPSDGKLLFRPSGITTGDQGWAPPVVLGELMYSQRYGVTSLNVYDFTGCAGDAWTPRHAAAISLPGEVSRKPDGSWIDRWTAGSPLVWEGLLYQVDIYGALYVVDLATKEMVYRRDLPLRGLMHYNAVPVAASPTLLGRRIFIVDNQGTTLVIEPGREFKLVARNTIDTQLERRWPVPAQETLAYAPPITDGRRVFLRGERYLYCIE